MILSFSCHLILIVIIPILWMRKLRHREIEWFSSGFLVEPDDNLGPLAAAPSDNHFPKDVYTLRGVPILSLNVEGTRGSRRRVLSESPSSEMAEAQGPESRCGSGPCRKGECVAQEGRRGSPGRGHSCAG